MKTRLQFSTVLIGFCVVAVSARSVQGAVPAAIVGSDVVSGQSVRVETRGARQAAGGAQVTVVAFLSARCPCSASHELVLTALANEYASKGFRFIGVHSNADEPAELAKEHFAAAKLPFPVINDDRARLADEFGALKTPHVYVVAANGEVLYQGGVDDSHIAATASKPYLKQALVALSTGNKPDPSETRTLGCAIKRP